MNDVPIQKAPLGKHGFISYKADPDQEYKWLLHESLSWFAKAKDKHGPEWKYYDNDSDPVTYRFDSLGFRSDYELADVDGEWILSSTECIGVGPGLHSRDLYHKILEERMGIPFYNASTYGGRLEYVPFNLLQLSKIWKQPPKHIILIGSQNSTGIGLGLPGVPVSVKNIDYFPMAMNAAATKVPSRATEKDLLFLYQSLGVAKWQHMIMMKTIIRLGESWDIPITWINGTSNTLEDMSPLSTYNYIDDSELNLVHQFMHGVGITLPEDPEEALQAISDTVTGILVRHEPVPGATLDDVSRDLFHPGAKTHMELANKIEFELDSFGTLNS